jgi:hypothetical protein
MGIETKTVGYMIDELFTTCFKLFLKQETVMNSTDEKEIATAAKEAQHLNARRNQLIRAIDQELNQSEFSVTGKTYA